MAGKEIKVSKTYKSKDGFKLNAQWLKNATASLGSNATSVLQDISPNIYGVAESAASLKRTLQRSKLSQNEISQTISGNKYVKMGRSAIDNALKDLKSGNFNNTSRGDTKTDSESATYNFGEITDENGETTGQIQATINVNPEGLNEINASITKQTKYQMQSAKANVDAIVASSSAMLAMNQKNAEASLNMLTNINNSLQAIVKYNNENMTKFITSSMTYYEMMGRAYASKEKPKSDRMNGSDIFDAKGNLNYRNLGFLLKQNAKDRYETSLPGQLVQMIDMMGDELVANPLKAISTTVMKSAIPKAVQKATKDLDKTFGNFITEMMMKTSQSLLNSTGKGSKFKNLLGSLLDINVDRKNNFNTENKVTKDAAVFDGITRNSITVEIPKYLRESTSYLRQLVMLNGGDPDKAIATSQIFNKESGRFENYEDFTKNLLGSINDSITSVFEESDFGKTLSKIADNEKIVGEQSEAFKSLLRDFYIALEKDSRSRIDITKNGPDSDISQIISKLAGDKNLKNILEETVYASFKNGRGGINLNSTRLAAKAKRNQVISDIEESNLGEISSILKPGQKIDDALASVLYGQDGRSTRTQAYTPNSLMGKITNIEDLLERGINVRIQQGDPFGPLSRTGGTRTNTSTNATVNPSGVSSGEASNAQVVSGEELKGNIEEALGENNSPATGRGAIFVNKSEHLGNMMHYMLKGDMTKVYSEMGALFGDGLRGLGTSINNSVLKPLKGFIFGKDDRGEPNSITGKVSQMFTNLKSDMADFVLGPKNENGKRDSRKTSIKGFLEEGLKGWSESLFGPDKSLEDVKKEITEKVQKNSDIGLKGAVAGAGLGIASGGILGTLVGGPLTGAVLGTASAIFANSKSFQKLMFGEELVEVKDENGNKKFDVKKGGLISPQTQEFFKDHKKDMMGAAGIGAIGGALTGGGFLGTLVGGPVAGALLGTAVGIAKNSDKFKEFVFGKEEIDEKGNKQRIGGILGSFNKAFANVNKQGEEDKTRVKKLAGMNMLGAGTGLLAGMFTPLGPIGGAALGLASSMYASKNKFHDLLFGTEKDEGENKGLLGKLGANIQKTVVAPLAGIAADALDSAKDAVMDKVLDPILDIVEPFAGLTRRLYDKVEEKVSGAFDKVGNFFSNITKSAFGAIKGIVGSIFNRKKGDEKGPKSGFGLLGKVSDKIRKSNEKASYKKWKSDEFKNSDAYADAYAEMENNWNNLSPEERSQYKNIDEYEKEFAKNYFFNGGNSRADRLRGREQRRKDRVSARQERRDKINRESLITELTKGKYSTDTEEGRRKALEAYQNSRRGKKGKGLYGISNDEIQRLLGSNGDAKINSSSEISEQIDIQKDQLDAAKEQLNILDRIYVAITGKIDEKFQNSRYKREGKKQQKREEKYERVLAKYDKKQNIADAAISVRSSLQEKSDASSDYAHGFFIAKDLKKPINKALNDPNDDKHDLALIISDPSLSRKDRQEAYDKFKDLLGYKKSQRKANRKNRKDNIAIARNSKREITRLTNEKNKASLNELSRKAGGRGYATGTGNAKQGDAVVGENGPEIVRFGGGEKVLPNNSTIKVRLEEVNPSAAKVMNDNGTLDVNLIGQNGPIVTYGTAAKLDNNTDNKSQIEKALAKKDTLVSYSQIKADNDELGENGQGKEETSIWDKIKESLSGLLKTGGIFATIYGIVKLLGNEKVQGWISNLFGVLGDVSEQKQMLNETNGYENGADATTNMKNQTERLTSLFSDPKEFLLGSDGKADSMTGSFLHAGRTLADRLINGKTAKGAVGTLISNTGKVIRHPLKSLTNAVFHPVKSFNAVTSTVANAGKSIGNTIAHPVQTMKNGLKQFGAQASFVKNAGTAIKEGGFNGLSGLVDETLQTANGGARRGLAGKLFNLSDSAGKKSMQMAEKYGVDLSSTVGGKFVLKQGAEAGAKETAEATAEKLAKEGMEKAAKKGAATVLKEGAEETGEKGIQAFIKKIPKYVSQVGEFLAGSLKKVLKKGGSEAIEKATKEIAEEATQAVTKGLAGKLKSWIMKKITGLLALISGTAAVSATGVGFLGVLAKDAAFITIGALNNMGKGGAARLFRCEQKDVDGKMKAISTAFGGLVEIGIPGAVIDVLNEIVCAVTGIDLLSELATLIYNGISSKEQETKLAESKTAHMEKYKEYSEQILEEEYQQYLIDNNLTSDQLTKDQFSELVSTGQVKTKKKGFDEWNDSENKTALAKAGSAIKSGATAAWGGIKNAGSAVASGAKKAGEAIATGAKNVGNAVSNAASSVWNGAKDLGSKAVSGVKSAGTAVANVASNALNGAKDLGSKAISGIKGIFGGKKEEDTAEELANATVEKAKNSIETFDNIQTKGLEALKTGLGIGKNVAKKATDFGKNLLSNAKDFISGKKDSLFASNNAEDEETSAMNSIVSSVAEKVLKIPRAIGQMSSSLLGFFKNDKESDGDTNSLFGKITSVASSLFGKNKSTTENTKTGAGGVPFYSQKDPRWGNIPYTSGGKGESMGEIGCGPTAFAMAASGSGYPMDPVQAAGAMQRVGARDNTGTNWSGIGRAASMYGIESHMQQNPSAGFIDSELDAGNPVILSGRSGGFGNTPYTPQGHYVVATGRDSNGNYIVNDPNRMGGSTRYNKNDILSETGAAWGFGGKGYVNAEDGSVMYPSKKSKNSNATTTTSSTASTGTGVTPSDVVKVATNEIGYLEKSSNGDLYSKEGNAGKNNFTKYAAELGFQNGQFWCATFVSWCLYTAANKNKTIAGKLVFGNLSASCEILRKQFVNAGRYSSSNPQPGDLIFFSGTRHAGANHIGIVSSVSGGKVYTVEGNTSSANKVVDNGGAVASKSYDLGYDKILGYGRPLYDGVSNFDGITANDSSATVNSSYTGNSASIDTSNSGSSSGSDIFSKITTFFSELGSRTLTGLTTGNFNSDWSGVFDNNGSSNSSTDDSYVSYESGTSDSSGNTSTPVTAASGVAKGTSSEKKLWNLFKQKGLNDYGTAGVMGNLFSESGLRTNNVQDSCEKRVGKDTEYTAKVDNGTYTNFANDNAGYGLAQWTYSSRKQGLLDLARKNGKSIADEDIQTTYLLNELNSKSYKGLYDNLKNSTSVKQASDLFMTQFERPKDQSDKAKATRASRSQAYYDKYATGAGGGYGGFGEGNAVSTGTRNPLYGNRVVSSGNKSEGDRVSEVIHYLSQILAVLGESSDKLNALNSLKDIAKNSGGTINSNNYYSTTNNSVQQGSQTNSPAKTDPSKYGIAEKIAKGGL